MFTNTIYFKQLGKERQVVLGYVGNMLFYNQKNDFHNIN